MVTRSVNEEIGLPWKKLGRECANELPWLDDLTHDHEKFILRDRRTDGR